MPSTDAKPKKGTCSVASTRIVDDLPAPLGPMNPNTSPRGMANEIPRTASTEPYFTHRFEISTIGTGEMDEANRILAAHIPPEK